VSYRQAIRDADHFKLVAWNGGDSRVIDLGSRDAWLALSNLLMWSRRNHIDAVTVYAVGASGSEMRCGGWKVEAMVVTPEEIEAGHLSFRDDVVIKAMGYE
jgi:hypothetical protein